MSISKALEKIEFLPEQDQNSESCKFSFFLLLGS